MKAREKENSKTGQGKGQGMRKLMVLSGYFLCAAIFLTGGFLVLRISGKYNLRKQTVSYAMNKENGAQASSMTLTESNIRQDGLITYQGQDYRYNDDILTFLFMGIDKESKVEASEGYGKGGQADALFLLVLDPHEEVMKLIPINCNTMTAMDTFDEMGAREDTITTRIGTQYGLGDGGKASCEYQVEAVRNLFYGIPINGYLAVNMDVIPGVITLIDGIDLEVLEDVRNGRREVILTQGEHVHMDGEQVHWYVRDRGGSTGLSADSRLARQTQFLTEFIGKVKRLTGKDLTLPVRIYHEIADDVVTDVSADEVAYLATFAGGYSFDEGQIFMVPGKSVSGEEDPDSGCDKFYAREDELYGMVIDIFYEPVE